MIPERRESRATPWCVLALALWISPCTTPAAALSWQREAGHRHASLTVPPAGNPGFSLLSASETGIHFTNHLSDQSVAKNRLLEIGSGVALGDVDGDGLVDVYLCRLEGDNVLYRNLGNWKFEDITQTARVACPNQYSTGCALVDMDGDGDLDLLVTGLGAGIRLFLNDGQGRFNVSTNSSLQQKSGATSMAMADVEGDGDLELYVCNYRTDTFFDYPPGLVMNQRQRPDGSTVLEPVHRFHTLTNLAGTLEILEKGEPDSFYLNRGEGRFALARWKAGVFRDEDDRQLEEPPTDWGLSVMFRDLNGDGLPDLYVCNDFVHWPDRIWLNQGGINFRAAPRRAFRNVSLSSMAVDAADINRDGFDDLFVADMLSPQREFRAWQRPDTLKETVRWPVGDPDFRPEVPRNTLHLARGDGTFAEIAQLAGVHATDWTWGATFVDVDLDGWEDLLITAGANHDVQDADVLPQIGGSVGWKTPEARLQAFRMLPGRSLPSLALRNRGDLTFEEMGKKWGFDQIGVAQGMALGDLDNDGDLDVVVNCLNSPARVLRNQSPAPRLAVRLKGALQNTRGVGAKITVRGGPVTQSQEMIAAGRYLSSDDPMRVFAAGNAAQLQIEVVWRSGKRSVIQDCRPNRVYEIDENTSASDPKPAPATPAPLFENFTSRIHHSHVDAPFDDFVRQPLLPRKLSELGPGISWFDVDGDDRDDLIVGAGRDGRLAVFFNDGKGGLKAGTDQRDSGTAQRDQTTVLGWRGADGKTRLIVGESNWEDAKSEAPIFRLLPWSAGADAAGSPGPSSMGSASGPLAMADVDGDGDLDLFVGGRTASGRYPEPATSRLFRNDADQFVPLHDFATVGLVSGAVFSDYDNDGDPDLILACEWDSIRIFRNDRAAWTEATESLGMKRFTGWWNGVAVGDFDGDGLPDLVASNWGRNWRTDQPDATRTGVELYHGEFAADGVLHTLLASEDPWLSKTTPWTERKRVMRAIPAVGVNVTTYRAYGKAGISELLGERANLARRLTAATTDSMIFLNRGDRFEPRPLPIEAQFAPVFGVTAADFDGDGNEDLFLAQNFFGVDLETSRHDGGAGLMLTGDGRGGFHSLAPAVSGIAIYGQQRGSAAADFDGDGRMDLAVGQNRGQTVLYRNQGALPGVRIRLRGSQGNPHAVGATVRVRHGDRWSRLVEIHAGAGYWSQDSAVALFAATSLPTAVQVKWPDGKRQEHTWPALQKSVDVSKEGIRSAQ